ncbi:MAG: HAMP domain-containing protein [Deltaproteobacteria bacterium]|nr:HAMP domain-containing protein [Deltaproteobacteria bacterium]
MTKTTIHKKILYLVIVTMSLGAIIIFYQDFRSMEQAFIKQKVISSKIVVQPILNNIVIDMTEGRPDMVRHLLSDSSKTEGIESIQVIRSNGEELAFWDFKTVNEVLQKNPALREYDLFRDYEEKEIRRPEGVDTFEFRQYLKEFNEDQELIERNYIEKDGKTLVYLKRIAEEERCLACHKQGVARGILMVRNSLEGIYGVLVWEFGKHILKGLAVIVLLSMLLSVLIRKTISGPLGETVDVIEKIKLEGTVGRRVTVFSNDEIGSLINSFNEMIAALEKREAENKVLLDEVRRSHADLRESHNQWVSTFDAIKDAICIHDKSYNILEANISFRDMFGVGRGDTFNARCHEVIHNANEPDEGLCPGCVSKDDEKKVRETYDARAGMRLSVKTFCVYSDKGEQVAAVHSIKDITEEKILKDQLIHSEKMSSLGKFVAGIAHELNNPLTGIMGYSQMIMDASPDDRVEKVQKFSEKLYKESVRTSKILKNLMMFSSAKEPKRTRVNINDIVRDTISLKENVIKDNNIKLEVELDEELPDTMADFFQMQQVFVNLLNNSLDAISEKSEGERKIKIVTSHEGRIIKISLIDSGAGVDEEVIRNVFDPFFTTKEVGKGTGLGLSVCHSIIKDHHGWIDIRNVPDGGAEVIIEVPVIAADIGFVEEE